MASDFVQTSEKYLSYIDLEVERLQKLRAQVAALIQGEKSAGAPPRRGMSDEGRRRIAEAQKARWAKQKRAAKRNAAQPGKKVATTKRSSKSASKKVSATRNAAEA